MFSAMLYEQQLLQKLNDGLGDVPKSRVSEACGRVKPRLYRESTLAEVKLISNEEK